MTIRSLQPRARVVVSAIAVGAAALALLLTSLTPTPARAAGRAHSATAACTAGGLVVWLDTQGNGTAGTIFYKLKFTNLSGKTCTLRGWPGVSAVNLRGQQLGSAARRVTTSSVRTIKIRNGKTASANLGIVAAGNFSNCKIVTAAGLRVYAPNQSHSHIVPFPFQACSKRGPKFLTVSPVS